MVVVLINGGPLSVPFVKQNVPTVVEAFEGGEAGVSVLVLCVCLSCVVFDTGSLSLCD